LLEARVSIQHGQRTVTPLPVEGCAPRRGGGCSSPSSTPGEEIDAATARFEAMGDEIPEEIRGRRTSVEVYEVVFDGQL
jgi:hypothetical protein